MVAEKVLDLQQKNNVHFHMTASFLQIMKDWSFTQKRLQCLHKDDDVISYWKSFQVRDVAKYDCLKAPVDCYCWYELSTPGKCCFILGNWWTTSLPSVWWFFINEKGICSRLLVLCSLFWARKRTFQHRFQQTMHIT